MRSCGHCACRRSISTFLGSQSGSRTSSHGRFPSSKLGDRPWCYSHSLSSGGGCASLCLACQRLVLNSSPRHRDFTRLCSSAAAPQFAPIGVWSACVSCSCSLLGMGPLWPSPFLRWAQCPSSRQLHQTFRWGRRSGSPAAMALQHHCSWRCARRQTPS